MLPIEAFDSVWQRANLLRGLHDHLAATLTVALKPDELLRAEWVCRVSALDLYVHEIVAQKLVAAFAGAKVAAKGAGKFQIGANRLFDIMSASQTQAEALFDLEVRAKLSLISYQDPEKIADGIRLVSDVELWNEIALQLGATPSNKATVAKSLKQQLSLIVERRNKIAHEGDLQPSLPREEWPIAASDLDMVKAFLESLIDALEKVV
ncbi:MAG: hypothetical protein IV086_12585 [Hyphomonadaceae bacterium]|nr:hypothetical protein [Hyphomonadaceae bacterium]